MRAPVPACPSRRSVVLGVPALATAAALSGLGGCAALQGVAPGSPTRALRSVHSLSSQAQATVPPADVTTSAAAAAAASGLGSRLLRQRLKTSPSSNALVCPAGLSLTLAMLYAQAPALGEGVAELLEAGTDGDAAARDTMWRRAQLALQRFDTVTVRELQRFDPDRLPEQPLVHVANNLLLVGAAKDRVNQSYVDAVRTWYDAPVSYVTLDQAVAATNAWASLHTGGLVRRSSLQLDGSTSLVLQNAMLLAARWSLPFRATETLKDQVFHLPEAGRSRADLMASTAYLPVVEDAQWRALRLPYGPAAKAGSGKGLALDVVLPRETVHPLRLGEQVGSEATAALTDLERKGRSGPEVRVRLPRLDLTTEATDLLQELRSLGIELSRLEHIGPDLVVSQTVQQARLVVDEEGTVAAALTEAQVGVSAPLPAEDPVEFFVDHPFVARIVDTATGMPVFEAVVMDPASRSAL